MDVEGGRDGGWLCSFNLCLLLFVLFFFPIISLFIVLTSHLFLFLPIFLYLLFYLLLILFCSSFSLLSLVSFLFFSSLSFLPLLSLSPPYLLLKSSRSDAYNMKTFFSAYLTVNHSRMEMALGGLFLTLPPTHPFRRWKRRKNRRSWVTGERDPRRKWTTRTASRRRSGSELLGCDDDDAHSSF